MGRFAAILVASAVLAAAAVAGEKIQDNSFLIEEAYNQEDGVIQHIQMLQWDRNRGNWIYSFTEEWPTPRQNHQLSFTVPLSKLPGTGASLGDVLLNYRYQAVLSDRLAFAPRLSLVLNTGRWQSGYGKGAPGLQANLPLSVDLSESWTVHVNLGATWTHRAVGAPRVRRDTLDSNAGASAVFHVNNRFNPLVELVGARLEAVRPDGSIETTHTVFVNPGVRMAFNRPSGLQIVPGLAYTIGIGPSSGSRAILLYLSFEHPLRTLQRAP